MSVLSPVATDLHGTVHALADIVGCVTGFEEQVLPLAALAAHRLAQEPPTPAVPQLLADLRHQLAALSRALQQASAATDDVARVIATLD